jgi:prepilin-type N-terminal cleavage/methylation domain-containing protein
VGCDVKQRKLWAAFTLVELLVVIAIIAVLIAILLPVLSGVREQANRVKCMSNLRGMGQAMRLYAYDNKNQYPRVLFRDAPVQVPQYFTGDRDSDPFETAGVNNVDACDVTAGIYLLVRYRMLPLESFLCPSSSQELDRLVSGGVEVPASQRSNFSGKKPMSWSMSYAFANLYPPVNGWYVRGEEEFKNSPNAPAQNAIAADRNDGIDRFKNLSPDAAQSDMEMMNSRNHRGKGQNVLFNDGSVLWCKTPFVGYTRDNIYTRATAAGWPTLAAHKYDSVLGPQLPLNGPGPL